MAGILKLITNRVGAQGLSSATRSNPAGAGGYDLFSLFLQNKSQITSRKLSGLR